MRFYSNWGSKTLRPVESSLEGSFSLNDSELNPKLLIAFLKFQCLGGSFTHLRHANLEHICHRRNSFGLKLTCLMDPTSCSTIVMGSDSSVLSVQKKSRPQQILLSHYRVEKQCCPSSFVTFLLCLLSRLGYSHLAGLFLQMLFLEKDKKKKKTISIATCFTRGKLTAEANYYTDSSFLCSDSCCWVSERSI